MKSSEPPEHDLLWSRFATLHRENRLTHALLFIGSLHNRLQVLVQKMATALFCSDAHTPCGHCQSCGLMAINEHPDLTLITSEKAGSVIRVDQIRELHQAIFTGTQLGGCRIIIINPAEKMNTAAANALLKILEEPPENTFFLLIAEHVSTLLPTILSRCQQWRLPSLATQSENYLHQGSLYPPESGRGSLFARQNELVENLARLQYSEISASDLATQWSVCDVNDVIWLLYLINAQMIHYCFNQPEPSDRAAEKLLELARQIKPVRLFAQLDKLNEIIKNLNHTVSVNPLLMLEDLLLGYMAVR